MSVYLRRGVYHYDFEYKGQRHRGSTGQRLEEDARLFEGKLKLQLRQDLAGVGIADPNATPRIQDFAEIYYDEVLHDPRIRRPERIADLLRVVLRFFGAKPEAERGRVRAIAGEPYHDLHLGDVVADPYWVVRFEKWMRQRVVTIPVKPGAPAKTRGISGQTKNQYRSVMSQLFELARSAGYRQRTRITTNPFDGVKRDPRENRQAIITPAELLAIVRQASYHVRLAVAIGALAPKLRLGNILALEWGKHIDEQLRYITIAAAAHKTGRKTGRALVLPISQQLREILEDARDRAKRDRVKSRHVVTYRGEPIGELRDGLRRACDRAGVAYGRFVDAGVTFHSLRHTAATMLAELGVGEGLRKDVMGHEHIGTTQLYTHVRPIHLEAPVEQLSAVLPIKEAVTQPWRRASRKRSADVCTPVSSVGESVGTPSSRASKSRTNSGSRETTSAHRQAG